MLVAVSEKLFYGKYGYKVLLKQTGSAEEFKDAYENIQLYLLAHNVEFKQRKTSSSGLSLCFNCEETLRWMRVQFPDIIHKLFKLANEHHKEELAKSDNIRIRPLFFRKFKYAITFSRFRARLHGINLGANKTVKDNIGFEFESGEGELISLLNQYDRNDWHIVNNYNITVYCNSVSLVMQLRLKYEAIITSFKQVKTKEELGIDTL